MTLVRTSPSGPNVDTGGGGEVTSVFDRTGDVEAQTGDYTSAQVTNASSVPGVSAADADDALQASLGALDSSDIANASTVTGVTVTAALETLKASSTPLLAYREYLSGSGTHVFNPASTLRIVHIQGGGGGGGGVLGASSSCRCAAGGQAGGWKEIVETGAPTGTGIYAVGAAGTGGISNTSPGTVGGDTSIGLSGGTQTAAGGIFGVNRQSGGTTAGVDTPAPGPGVPNDAGDVGSVPFNLTSSLGISGSGGNSLYGRGGFMFIASGARDGQDGVGRGSGGSGGSVVNTGSANGGNGVGGLIRIWEFG